MNDKILDKTNIGEVVMSKTDILHNNLYITKIRNVIKSFNKQYNKLLYVKSRRSDAFVYIISGSCTYNFDDGNEFTVRKGDIMYLSNKANYTMKIHTTDYRYIFCDFEFDGDYDCKSDVYSLESPSYAENLFYKLLKVYSSPSRSSFAESMAILYNIYGLVLSTANEVYLENFSKKRISDAKEYIDKNFKDSSLCVSFLSEKAGISEVYFRKLFKSQYHISPSQYIISIRLERAKELMKYPFLSLEECALQSGFSTLQYFCRVFKKKTGTTPAKYRNQK